MELFKGQSLLKIQG